MKKKKFRSSAAFVCLIAATGLAGCKKKPTGPLPTLEVTGSLTPTAVLVPSPMPTMMPTPYPTGTEPKPTVTPQVTIGLITPVPSTTMALSATPSPTKPPKETPIPTKSLTPTLVPTPTKKPLTPTNPLEVTKEPQENPEVTKEPEATMIPEPTATPTPTPVPTKAPDYAGLMKNGWQTVSDLGGGKTVYFPAVFREAEPIFAENFYGFAYTTQDGKRSSFRMIREHWNEGESLSQWIQLRYEKSEAVKESEDDYSFSFEENNRMGKGRIYFCDEEKTTVIWLELLWDGDPSAEDFDFFLR